MFNFFKPSKIAITLDCKLKVQHNYPKPATYIKRGDYYYPVKETDCGIIIIETAYITIPENSLVLKDEPNK